MNERAGIRLGWFTFVAYLVLACATLVLQFANDRTLFVASFFNALVLLAFAVVGALIVSRRPENRIGWLLCAGTLLWAAGLLALQYAIYALVTVPGALPGGDWVGVFGGMLRGLGSAILLTYVLLLFPNGHLPSTRWRPAVWLALIPQILFVLACWIAPASFVDPAIAFISSPLRVPIDPATLETPILAIFLLSFVSFVVAGVSVFSRFRHAQGDERQQLKLFAYAALLASVTFMIIFAVPIVGIPSQVLNSALFSVAVMGLPVALGIAILKYHLYEIDLIIRRTLTYLLVTGLLVVVYFVNIIVLQQVFSSIIGSRQNEIITVISTLAIAALFVPLRNRMQGLIDRRFNRKKYDAQMVLSKFGESVRDETDLEKLTARLMAVVNDTMQPKSVSLWLKKDQDKTQPHR